MPILVVRLLFLLLAPPAEERVLFLVDTFHDETGWYAEPIAFIRGGHFVGVVDPYDTSFAPYHHFIATYFSKGKQYPVYWNDKRLGAMTVVEPDTQFACMQLTAQVQMKYSGKEQLTLGSPGIALSGAKPPKLLLSFATTTQDSSLAMVLARKELTGKKLSKAALKSLQLNRIRAVDLDGSGDAELVATFETSRTVYSKSLQANSMIIYFLSIVIDDGKVVYSYYTSGPEEGDEQGNFASRQDITGISDLDSDGIGEIIFRNFYYESWDYSIVKKKANRWQQVWKGGGGGC
jgi:hypothetical protein